MSLSVARSELNRAYVEAFKVQLALCEMKQVMTMNCGKESKLRDVGQEHLLFIVDRVSTRVEAVIKQKMEILS